MITLYKKMTIPLSIISVLSMSACDSSDTEKDVVLDFSAKVNGTDFTCGTTYNNVGSNSNDYTVDDFRLYIYDIQITDKSTGEKYTMELDQDGQFQLDNIALLDFENGCGAGTTELNTMVSGKVKLPGLADLTNSEVCFQVGLPEDKNHLDAVTAASPLNNVSMLWAWKVGRKYVRIDGTGDPSGTAQAFNLHLGAQGCGAGAATQAPAQSCTFQNTFEVCMDNIDVTKDTIVIDPAPVLEANDISTTLGGTTNAAGCQSFANDNDCIEVMPRFGLTYSYGNGVSTSAYTGGQRLFTLQSN